jgi:hypothetical protein
VTLQVLLVARLTLAVSQGALARVGNGQDVSMDTGLMAAIEFHVTEHDTAAALLSGDLPVLGTPRLLAWLESSHLCGHQGESAGRWDERGHAGDRSNTAPRPRSAVASAGSQRVRTRARCGGTVTGVSS